MNIFSILEPIKTKLMVGVIVVLTTLLASSLFVNHYKNEQYLSLVQSNAATLVVNSGLTTTVKDLREQLKNVPNNTADVVKGIDMELCKGLLDVKDILNLPPTTVLDVYPTDPNSKEVEKNEKAYVDIDAPLPPSLVKLLNED